MSEDVSQKLSDSTGSLFVGSVIVASAYLVLTGLMGVWATFLQIRGGEEAQAAYFATVAGRGELTLFGFAVVATMGVVFFMLPKHLGKDLHSRSLASFSLWTLNLGVVGILSTWLAGFGSGSKGFLPVIFADASWPPHIATLFILSQTLIVISIFVFCVEVLLSVFQRPEDPSKGFPVLSAFGLAAAPKGSPRAPIFAVGAVTGSLIMLVTSVGFFAYLGQGYLGLLNLGGIAEWVERFNGFWFFGHPAIFFLLLPYIGLLLHYTASSGGRSVGKGAYRPWPLFLVLPLLMFTQLLLEDPGMPFRLNPIALASNAALVIPLILTAVAVVSQIMKSKIVTLPGAFMLSGLAGVLVTGLIGIQLASPMSPDSLRSSLLVSGHLHLALMVSATPFVLGGAYLLLSDVHGKIHSNAVAWTHFGTTLVGGFGYALVLGAMGYMGAPEGAFPLSQAFGRILRFLLFFGLIFAIGQILFLYNVVRTVFPGGDLGRAISSRRKDIAAVIILILSVELLLYFLSTL